MKNIKAVNTDVRPCGNEILHVFTASSKDTRQINNTACFGHEYIELYLQAKNLQHRCRVALSFSLSLHLKL